jgi:hypothetical protein
VQIQQRPLEAHLNLHNKYLEMLKHPHPQKERENSRLKSMLSIHKCHEEHALHLLICHYYDPHMPKVLYNKKVQY